MLIGFRVRRNTGFSATILAVHLFLHRDALCTDSRSDIPSRFHLEKFRGTIKIERFRSFHIVPCSIYSFVSSLEGSFFPSIVSARESDEVKKMATLRCGGTAFVFFFFFSFFFFPFFFLARYTRLMGGREGGAVLYFLHSWVSMSQSARAASIKVALIPFARSLDQALARSLHCGFVRDRKSITLPTYSVHIFSTTRILLASI